MKKDRLLHITKHYESAVLYEYNKLIFFWGWGWGWGFLRALVT